MLKILTYVEKSLIKNAGLGLFVQELIKKDTLIWKFDKDLDQIVKLPNDKIQQEFILKYGYLQLDNPTDYVICLDNARFMNHSENPNCYCEENGTTWAIKDILPNEELTCNYNSFCFDKFIIDLVNNN